MKKIYFISCILTLMFITGCNSNLDGIYISSESETRSVDSSQLDYYWYQGKKIFLKQKATKQYILFYAEKEPVVAKAIKKIKGNSYASEEFKLTCVKVISKTAKTKNLKWCIVQNGNACIRDLAKSSDIEYYAPFFEDIDNGEDVGISHLFYVKLKTMEDRDLLINLASKLKVEVLGYNEYMPLWYTLSCDLNSAGNSLQMANAFYESGLFEATEPAFMCAVKLASTSASSFPNDTYFNKQGNLDGTYSTLLN